MLTFPTKETRKYNNHNYASQNEINNNQTFNAPVTQTSDHIISKNANDVLDIAAVIDQVVTSRSVPETLNDSLHAPKRQSIVNLPSNDLRHRLNALRHKPTSDQSGFLLIKAISIAGYNRLDKLNFIRNIFQPLQGFMDLNWMYHDHHATVIVEFNDPLLSQQAQQKIQVTNPDLDIIHVKDMRTIINHSRSSTEHTPRSDNTISYAPPDIDDLDLRESSLAYPEHSYRLKYVPLSLTHDDIRFNLSYYGHIELIQEIANLPSTQREVQIIFDRHARFQLLDHIWAVNVREYNIPIAKAHLSDDQLAYRKLHIAGFKGFNYKTTESQALRLFRPYGGMSCHLQQN